LTQFSGATEAPAPSAGWIEPCARIAPVYLIPLLAEAERAGIMAEALFHGLGLAAADLAVPGLTISPMEANTVVRRALRLLNTPDLGLMLGMKTRITERGAMALGLMAAATLRDAIALTLQFPGAAGNLLAVHAERRHRLQQMMAEPMFDNHDIAPFLVDIMFAGSVRIRRQVTESSYTPASVDLMRPCPANSAAYERFFACPVRFGCKRNILATDLGWLDYPLPMANAMAYRLSLQLLEQESERAVKPSALGLTVERAIRRALPLAVPPVDLAHSLNLSERSLRRKLAEAGLSFSGLLDEARKARALELMAGASPSITVIAIQTGFSDVRAFSRAFKRWTGSSPSALRAALRTPEPENGGGNS